MKSSSLLTTSIQNTIIVLLLGLSVFFQARHDQLGPPFTTRLKAVRRNLLPPQILPYMSFGFRNIITDYYWISSIQDFVAWNRKEGYFIGYFKNISTLDPKFEYPYLFSILTIPQKERKDLKKVTVLDEIAAISEKGMQAIPTSWQIPFYLGTQYYIFTKAYDPAEHYLAIAATKETAPDGVYLLYSTFVGKGLFTTAQKANFEAKLIKTIYNNTDNEIIKKLAGKGIQETYITQLLEKGIIAYNEKYKRYPKTVQEMIDVHFIVLPKELLENFTIEISPRDGSFKIIEKESALN
jgi:hypothetical protein